MENTTSNATIEVKTSKDWWIAGYVVAGSILSFAQQFNKSSLDEFIILAIAIVSGCFYHKLKRRIGIKNDVVRSLATYFALLATAAFLIGVFTRLT